MRRKMEGFDQGFLEQDTLSVMWLCVGEKQKRWLKPWEWEKPNVTVSAEQEWEGKKKAVAR